jgi:hypothetical protein
MYKTTEMHEDVEALAVLNRVRAHVAGVQEAWNLVARLTNEMSEEIFTKCQSDHGQFKYVLYNVGIERGRTLLGGDK